MVDSLNQHTGLLLSRIREQKPLIHQITNYVVMTDTANVTLHIGALPVMAHAPEEVAEMVQIAGALVLNYGTLSSHWVDAMLIAGRKANELGIPIVLDPVGAGATRMRTDTGLRLLEELQITIVRANAGEIGALRGAGGIVKGVESMGAGGDPVELVQDAARTWHCTVAMTGVRDLISDGERLLGVDNGHEWLQTRTGTGCAATAVTGAFAAVEPDPVIAATCALAAYGVAAEIAAAKASGPSSFGVAFFDQIYNLTPDLLEKNARIVALN